jgi:hypothetical protein
MSKWAAIRKLEIGERTVFVEAPTAVAKAVTYLRAEMKRDFITRVEYDGVHVIRMDRKL